MSESTADDLPKPHFALVAISIFVLAFLLLLSTGERTRFLGLVRDVTRLFDGPPASWPLDFRRDEAQAPTMLKELRRGTAWVRSFTDQLDLIAGTLSAKPSGPNTVDREVKP